jgi:hypothetical protein
MFKLSLLRSISMDHQQMLIELLVEKLQKNEAVTQPIEETKATEPFMKSDLLGKICMIRTYSAGVFYGIILEKQGKEVKVKNARRVWRWAGAASLSQLAMEGTTLPSDCKFPCAVAYMELTEVVEVIEMTQQAIKSLDEVAIWTA